MWNNQREENLKGIHDQIEEIEKLGTLRIWTLHVLEHGPKNGVEIMDAVEEHHERFHKMQTIPLRENHQSMLINGKNSTYRPLPGSIYPMLKKIVAEDLAVKLPDGRYQITDKGLEIVYNIFGHVTDPHNKINREKAVNNTINEIYRSLYYLEDIKKERLISHKKSLGEFIKMLQKIKDSLEEE